MADNKMVNLDTPQKSAPSSSIQWSGPFRLNMEANPKCTLSEIRFNVTLGELTKVTAQPRGVSTTQSAGGRGILCFIAYILTQ